jgi:hypothetical protein
MHVSERLSDFNSRRIDEGMVTDITTKPHYYLLSLLIAGPRYCDKMPKALQSR